MPDGSPPDASPSPRPPLAFPRLPALPPLGRAEPHRRYRTLPGPGPSPVPPLPVPNPRRARTRVGAVLPGSRPEEWPGRRGRPRVAAPSPPVRRGTTTTAVRRAARRTCTRRRRGSGAGGESLPGADSTPGSPDAGSPPGFRGRARAQAPGRNEARAGPEQGRCRAGNGYRGCARVCGCTRVCDRPGGRRGRGVRRRCPWRGARGGGRRGRRRRGGPRRGGAARRSCRWSRRGR